MPKTIDAMTAMSLQIKAVIRERDALRTALERAITVGERAIDYSMGNHTDNAGGFARWMEKSDSEFRWLAYLDIDDLLATAEASQESK